MKEKFDLCISKIILSVLGLLVITIISFVLLIQAFYPRFEQSDKTIDKIYALNYVDGEYVKVSISEEDKNNVSSIINHSWITVDFMAGDECGADGPGILITYNDGTSDLWGCSETDHAHYIKYYYSDKWGQTSVSINSNELLRIIESYTKQ